MTIQKFIISIFKITEEYINTYKYKYGKENYVTKMI